jgi:hypothetical protein
MGAPVCRPDKRSAIRHPTGATLRLFYSSIMMQVAYAQRVCGRLHDDVLSPGDKNARHQHENPAQGLS